jgi:hypothetical protein
VGLNRKRLLLLGAGGLLLALAAAAGGVRGFMVWQQRQDLLPELIDVPAGPRAPRREMLGLELGRTTLPEAEVVYRGVGVECVNTSFRALMEARRRQVKEKMEAAAARGDAPDGVTGASLVEYRSKKERNPQVRLSCEGVRPDAFGDRPRAPGAPLYWLLIFDSEKHPLRHTSISRRIADPAVAAEEWRSALDAMTRRFGAPTDRVGPVDDAGASMFDQGAYYQVSWRFADLHAEVHAFRVGRDVRFTEKVEIPWPVRSDGH